MQNTAGISVSIFCWESRYGC